MSGMIENPTKVESKKVSEAIANDGPILNGRCTALDMVTVEKLPKNNKLGKQWVVKDKNGAEIYHIAKTAGGPKDLLFGSFEKDVLAFSQPMFTIKRKVSYVKDAPCIIVSPNGDTMGYVERDWYKASLDVAFGYSFRIKNANKKTILLIKRPAYFKIPGLTDIVQKIYTKKGEKVGQIVKKCGNLKSLLPKSLPKYEVEFFSDLDNNAKYLILASIHLINKF